MKTQLYNTDTNQFFGPLRGGVYTIDGRPADLPKNVVEIEIIDLPYPKDLDQETQIAVVEEILDLGAKTFTRGWRSEEHTSELQSQR